MLELWSGPEGTVVPEREALTTAENARHVRDVALELGVSEVVVVTSSWHSPRATRLFRRTLRGTGVNVIAAPTTPRRPRLSSCAKPRASRRSRAAPARGRGLRRFGRFEPELGRAAPVAEPAWGSRAWQARRASVRAASSRLKALEREVGERSRADGARISSTVARPATSSSRSGCRSRRSTARSTGGEDTRTCTSAAPALKSICDDLPRRRAPDDRVVDDDEPLAGDLGERVELHADALLAHRLVGLDERAADVAVLDEAFGEGIPVARRTRSRPACPSRGSASRGRRRPATRLRAARPSARARRAPRRRRAGVRPREVEELEDAERAGRLRSSAWMSGCRLRRRGRSRRARSRARTRPEEVERARLGGDDQVAAEATDDERPDAVGSRKPTSFPSAIADDRVAPSIRHRAAMPRRAALGAFAIIAATTSRSEVDASRMPAGARHAARPRSIEVAVVPERDGRPGRAGRRLRVRHRRRRSSSTACGRSRPLRSGRASPFSSKTCVTRPRSRSAVRRPRSETAIPADS